MDGLDLQRRKSPKERLEFVEGCCSSFWKVQPTVLDDDDDEEEGSDAEIHHHHPPQDQRPQRGKALYPGCRVARYEARTWMNLAAAMAAERKYMAAQEGVGEVLAPGTSPRVSLMRLLEEGEEGGGAVRNDLGCCVCMVRKKGSAFIACGHTFCRVCSREIWLNQGRCPLCNRPILNILDIF